MTSHPRCQFVGHAVSVAEGSLRDLLTMSSLPSAG